MYHELKRSNRELCSGAPGYIRYAVAERDFHCQLDLLKSRGFQAVNVSQAFALGDCKSSVVITFDDGCETDLAVAVPALRQSGFNATFYVVSGFVGKSGYLSAPQLRGIVDQGFEIGCHSRTHVNLTHLDAAGLQAEIVVAKAELEAIIGCRVKHFSCPGGFWSRRAAQVASDAGFVTMATSRIGGNSASTDPYRLARVAMYRDVTLPQFEKICFGKGILGRRSIQSFLNGAKMLVGESAYRRIRTTILNAKVR